MCSAQHGGVVVLDVKRREWSGPFPLYTMGWRGGNRGCVLGEAAELAIEKGSVAD